MVQSQDVRYQVPDHDFPIASNHKLIPSFYLLLDGPANKGVKLSCFVRSQLFNSSSSESHSQDLMEMLEDVETVVQTKTRAISFAFVGQNFKFCPTNAIEFYLF
jgi:hypothetical protein